MNKTKKFVYFVNTDWFFISHRLPLAIEALRKGFEVHLVTNELTKREELENKGIFIHELKLNRKSWNPLEFIFSLINFTYLILKIRPEIIHCITIKPIIIGTLTGILTRYPKIIISITGLGSVFTGKNVFDRLKQFIVIQIYNLIFLKRNLRVIFQNNDDKKFILKKTILNKNKVHIIKGSGVDLNEYKFQSLKEDKPKVLFASRLLYSKGIKEFIEASLLVKDCEFIVAGKIDPGNPQSLTEKELNLFIKKYPINYVGFKDNIKELIYLSSIVVLPSHYREGLPKILIEAAACGRAIITTNNVGCKDAVLENKSGLIIPIKNSLKLSEAINYLISDKKLLRKMGEAGRIFATNNFDISQVIFKHFQIYNELIN